jgi:Uma2 family endonuclease
VENRPEIRRAPDVMVVFGRPKGARGSYIQHLESGIAPQVVFEILSRGNRILEMSRKFDFYQTYGVEEYYVYDHLSNDLAIWIRNQEQNRLEPIDHVQNWISPRLGIRFELTDESLNIFNPDGNKFLTYLEQVQQKEQALSAMSKYASKLREMGIDPENLL